MSDRISIRSAAVVAIKAANTSAGQSVYSPKDWPTVPETYPQILVRTPQERKQNVNGRMGAPEFDSTITLAVVGRVEATTELAAENALETLSAQIENAILTNGQFIFTQAIQQFTSVDTSMAVRSESELHYGETVVVFALEVRQYFAPTVDAAGHPMTNDLEDVDIIIREANTGVDLAEIDIITTEP